MAFFINNDGDSIHFVGDVSEGINFDINGNEYYFIATSNGVKDVISGMTFPRASLGGTSYLLDTYPAFAAYSTRLLKTGEVDCIDVREASGDTVATIGFADGWLDEAAVATHCSGANGFVSTWYDQSGNGYDATQATTTSQPQIYNGSAVLKENGKPALVNQVGGASQLITPSLSMSQPYTAFAVGRSNASNDYIWQTSTVNAYQRVIGSGTGLSLFAGSFADSATTYDLTTQFLTTGLANSTSSKGRLNGVEIASGDAGTNNISSTVRLGNDIAADELLNFQEFIFYNSDQTANFSAIEADQGNAFLSRHTVTAVGNAQLDGSNALTLDGTGDYLTMPEVSGDDLSSTCTIEMHVYMDTSGAKRGFLNKRASDANYSPYSIQSDDGSSLNFRMSDNGSSWGVDISSTISTGAWVHLALVANAGSVTAYKDGVSVGTGTIGTLLDNANSIAIGADAADGGGVHDGKIARVRISDGIARYTTTFTPPAYNDAIVVDSYDRLALNFDGAAASTDIIDSSKPDFVWT